MEKEISLQYLAGFFDGEGSIGLYKRKARVYGNGTSLRVQLTQNKSDASLSILDYLKNKYGGNITEQVTLSKKIKYNWQLNAGGIPIFLVDILPYLILKKLQAELALYWLANKPTVKRRGRVPYFTSEDLEFIDRIINQMKELKSC